MHEDRLPALLYAAYGKAIPPQGLRHIKRGCELMREVKDSDWDNHTPHHSNDIPVLARVNTHFALAGLNPMNGFTVNLQKLVKAESLLSKGVSIDALVKILEKDDDADEDDESDDSNDEESDDNSGDDSGNDGDDSNESDEDFNEKHPRWPAKSPDSTGGEFRPKDDGDDTSAPAPDSDPGSISADDVSNTLRDGFDNPSPSPQQGMQVADSGQIATDAPTLPAQISPENDLSVSSTGLNFIKQFEAFSSTVYTDEAGYPTIGYGHKLTDDESYPDGITEGQANQLLAQDISKAEDAVQRYVTTNLTQSQFDALVSFTFNEGPDALRTSTMLSYLNAGNFSEAANEFPKWNKITVNGVKIPNNGSIQ